MAAVIVLALVLLLPAAGLATDSGDVPGNPGAKSGAGWAVPDASATTAGTDTPHVAAQPSVRPPVPPAPRAGDEDGGDDDEDIGDDESE